MPPDSIRRLMPGLLVVGVLIWGGCLSDTGDQDDGSQVATATVVGAGTPVNGAFQVRSGSEVLLSGKDSDSTAAPFLTFEWEQIGVSPGDPEEVELFERDSVSRSFTAPDLDARLEFRFTATDSRGVATTDTVVVEVNRVVDTNNLLRDPRVREEFYLFVAPDTAGPVASRTSYSLRVTPVVTWVDRDGNQRTTGVGGVDPLDDILVASDEIEAGFEAPAPGTIDSTLDRHRIAIPLLDADEINKQFKGSSRGGRLEFEAVDNVQLSLEISLTGVAGSADLEVFVGRNPDILNPGPPFSKIEGNRLYPDLSGTGDLPRDAILNDARDLVSIDVEKLLQEVGAESKGSARNYYDCIDPAGEASTLSGWLAQVPSGVSFERAKYLNNYDLGFGRDMFVGKDDASGNVYSYVVNYPSLESLLKGTGEFATVVMEYSDAPTGACGDDKSTFSDTEKIVKFYAYSPNSDTGEMERALSQNFDGRGDRFLPGVCTACHDGDINKIGDFSPIDPDTRLPRSLADIPGSSADLDATFMPWDLDSFLYAKSEAFMNEAGDLEDPSLNRDEFSEAQLSTAGRESQEDVFRRFNEYALDTYLGPRDPVSGSVDVDSPARTQVLQRFEEPIRLIHLWYGNDSAIATPIESLANTRAVITDVGSLVFDGARVQPGWVGQEDLYRDVYARNCRMCHTQQNDLNKNFESYSEFIGAANFESYVFDQGLMPTSRLTLDRFWLDFRGGTSAAEILRTHLLNLVPPRDVADRTPGEPFASVVVTSGSSIINDGNTIDVGDPSTGALVETSVSLDGSGSLFADDFEWTVTTSPSGSGPCGPVTVAGEDTPQASFVIKSSPCKFAVDLTVQSGGGGDASSLVVLYSNREPEAANFTASNAGYSPGDEVLEVEVLSRPDIGPFGDPPLTLDTLQAGVSIDDVNGRLNVEFPPLQGINTTFNYDVIDDNYAGAEDNRNIATGQVTVNIPPISVVLSPDGPVVGNEVTLKWTVPDMFLADSYSLERDGPVLDGFFDPVAGCDPAPADCTSDPMMTCSCTDSPLVSGQEYRYRVRTNLGTDTATSPEISVSTLEIPQAVMSVQVGDRIDVTWSQGGTGAVAGYNVYRENLDEFPGSENVFADVVSPFSDFTIEQNTAYRYGVTQFDGGGNESARAVAAMSITTDVDPPRNIVAVAAAGAASTGTIEVDFEGPADGKEPASYTVQRQEGGSGPYVTLSPQPVISSSGSSPVSYFFDDTGLLSNTEYRYQIIANGEDSTAADTSNSVTTSVSFAADIQPFYPSGAGAFNTSCGGVGCHPNLADWKGDVLAGATNPAAFGDPTTDNFPFLNCLIDDDLTIQDCDTAHGAYTITTTMRSLLRAWQSQGNQD